MPEYIVYLLFFGYVITLAILSLYWNSNNPRVLDLKKENYERKLLDAYRESSDQTDRIQQKNKEIADLKKKLNYFESLIKPKIQ